MDRPWTFYDYLEPITVHYDGGIDLQGLAVGQGIKQLPLQQMLNLEKARCLWVSLRWQTQPGLDVDFAVSLRLHDVEGARVFQTDRRLALGHLHNAHTSFWPASELFDTLMHLEIPDTLPAGEYELRLIVYDTESLIPTVEIGVWEPEVVLTRLLLGDRQ